MLNSDDQQPDRSINL